MYVHVCIHTYKRTWTCTPCLFMVSESLRNSLRMPWSCFTAANVGPLVLWAAVAHISLSNSIRLHKRNRNVNSAVERVCVVLFRYCSVWLNAAVRIRLKDLILYRTLLMQPALLVPRTYHILPCAVREKCLIKWRSHFQGLYMSGSGRINSE